jgi:hypothetical protein
VQMTEQRLLENVEELRLAGLELAAACELLKTAIPKLLAERERARVKFMNLQHENAQLKTTLGRCR